MYHPVCAMKAFIFTLAFILFLPNRSFSQVDSIDYRLINAVKSCDYTKVNTAIGVTSDVDYADSSGKTALHYGVICGNPELVSLLLLHHANPLVEDKGGMTPLDYAELYEQSIIIEILLLRQIPTGVQAM